MLASLECGERSIRMPMRGVLALSNGDHRHKTAPVLILGPGGRKNSLQAPRERPDLPQQFCAQPFNASGWRVGASPDRLRGQLDIDGREAQ